MFFWWRAVFRGSPFLLEALMNLGQYKYSGGKYMEPSELLNVRLMNGASISVTVRDDISDLTYYYTVAQGQVLDA